MTKTVQYIIFDGKCGFCNKMIMFIAKKDRNNIFKFVSSFSKFGIELLESYDISGLEKSSIILINNQGIVYSKSTAIRKVILELPYYKLIGYLMFLFPEKISDYVYHLISKNRKMIIKNDICEIPTAEIHKKFIF